MTIQEYINIVQKPQTVSEDQTFALNQIIEEFPYFQSARAVHLKGLKNKESFKYNQALKTTAAYTTDRSILFDFITSDTFNQNEISDYIKQNTAYINDLPVTAEDISVNKNTSLDDSFSAQLQELKDVINPDLFQPKQTEADSKSETVDSKSENQTPEQILNIGKPLQFDKTETHSFNEWLKLTTFKPIDREIPSSNKEIVDTTIEEESDNERDKKFDLIDKWVKLGYIQVLSIPLHMDI